MNTLQNTKRHLIALGVLTLAGAASAADTPPAGAKGAQPPMSDQKMIESAMQAAPKRVAESATIVAMGADGQMRTLRQGSNAFTCMPDNPATPGPDPMCVDRNAMEWVNAWVGHKPPTEGKVGFMYMLSGGTDASNTDPYATQPTTENHWVKTGPHVMVVGAAPSFYDQYPKSPDPDTTAPYIMWAGTPYQHLMIPVR